MKYYWHDEFGSTCEHVIKVKNNHIVHMLCLHKEDERKIGGYKMYRPFVPFTRGEYKRITKDEYDRWLGEKAFLEAI